MPTVGQDPNTISGTIITFGEGTYNGKRYEIRWQRDSGALWVRINSGNGCSGTMKVRMTVLNSDKATFPADPMTRYCPLAVGQSITSLDQYGDCINGNAWSKVLMLHPQYTDGTSCHRITVTASSDGGKTWVTVANQVNAH